MNGNAIETHQLVKRFGNITALSGLSWQAPVGSLCGFLGPNGAGKTTTLKMLLGMIFPNAGDATVLGCDIIREILAIRRMAAFVPEDKVIYDNCTGAEFLKMYGSFFPEWSGEEASRLANQWQIPLEQNLEKLSRGARSKLLLLAALSRRPKMLLIDEPTEGLDPAAAEEVLQLLTDWIATGERTAVLATHRLDEVERICDRVALLDKGALALEGELDDLRSVWKRIDAPFDDEDAVRAWPQVRKVQKAGDRLAIVTQDDPAGVVERLRAQCGSGAEINVSDMNLREIYLAAVSGKGGN